MVEELRSAEPGNGAPEERSGAAPSARGGSGPRRSRGGVGKRFQGKPKVCLFCVEKGQRIDYKQADLLRRFVNESGKIRPRRFVLRARRCQAQRSSTLRPCRILPKSSPARGVEPGVKVRMESLRRPERLRRGARPPVRRADPPA